MHPSRAMCLARSTEERKLDMAKEKAASAAKAAPQQQPQPVEETQAMVAPNPDEETSLVEFDYGEDAGQGFENQDQSDRKIPMLVVLQDGTPIVKDRTKVSPSGRRYFAGQLLNTVTMEAYDRVDAVPAITDHCYVEFLPRAKDGSGGGFKGRHKKNAAIVGKAIAANGGNAFGKLPVRKVDGEGRQLLGPDGKPQQDTELVETFEIALVVFQLWRADDPLAPPDKLVLRKTLESDLTPETALLLPFSSTKIKHYKDFNSNVSMFQLTKIVDGKPRKEIVPMFSHRVKITTKLETKGTQSWYVPILSPLLPDGTVQGKTVSGMRRSLIGRDDLRYQAAKLLHDQILAGSVSGAYETTEAEAPSEGGGGEAGVPF